MNATSPMSFPAFARTRPPVGGYLYHGSPMRDLRLNERRLAREPFFATDRRDVALFFGTDGGRRPGTVHYVKPTGPFWTLVEDDVSDELGPFTSYIFARAGSARVAPLREVYRDYLQHRESRGEKDSRLPEGPQLDDYPTFAELRAEAARL